MSGAGERTDYQVTWLEMTERPRWAMPSPPGNIDLMLVQSRNPPVDWFLYLYGAVGGPWEWTDLFRAPRADVEAFVGDPETRLYTLMVDGWPGGFFMLDSREAGVCDLAYFGLVPEATGRGLGRWFLSAAITSAWARPGARRVTVNTCTLDHPAALGLYQKLGFAPYRRTTESRVLSDAQRRAGS